MDCFCEITNALRKMVGGKSRTMAAYLGEAVDEFDESKHPRGNPKNAGQFVKKGSAIRREGTSRQYEELSDEDFLVWSEAALNRSSPVPEHKTLNSIAHDVESAKRACLDFLNGDFKKKLSFESVTNAISSIAKVLGMRSSGGLSKYVSYELPLGNKVLRLSNHPAIGRMLGRSGNAQSYVSIVFNDLQNPWRNDSRSSEELRKAPSPIDYEEFEIDVGRGNEESVSRQLIMAVNSMLRGGDFDLAGSSKTSVRRSSNAYDYSLVEGLNHREIANNVRSQVRAQKVLDEIGGTVFGSAMAKDFKDQGKASLIGRSVGGADDIAALCSVYRNPSFETFRWFFVKDGKIAYQTGVTSRLPGHTTAVCKGLTQELASNVAALGGIDGFYCLHNHPTGNVNPSNADKILTTQIASRMTGYIGAKFLGHVVIDHDKYSVIDENGDATVGIQMKEKSSRFEDMEKEMDSPLLGADVSSTSKLAKFAAKMQSVSERGGDVQIVATGGQGFTVRGIASCPFENISQKSIDSIGDVMRRYAIASGAGECSLAVDESKMTPELVEKFKDCIHKRVFTDVVCMKDGKKAYGIRAKFDIHPGSYEFAQPIGRGGHKTDEIVRPE